MKLYFLLLAAILPFSACKKNNSGTTNDPTAILKNSVWTGDFNYTGKPAQPVSINFLDGGGGLVNWYDLSGTTSGTWKVANGAVTVTLSTGAGFTATVANGSSLSNIQNLATNGFTLNNAALNTLPDATLDNTTWTGTNVALHFKTGNKLDMDLGPTGSTKYTGLSYTREAKTIRFNALPDYKWFLVLNSIPMMKGANVFLPDPTVYPYQVNKQ